MHNMHNQVGILGAYVDSVTLDEALQRAHEFVMSGTPHQVVTVNVDFIRLAQENLEFRAIINRSDLAIADGMPLVWASKLSGERLPERVTGVELVEQCCALAAREGYSVFLLGGEDGVAEAAGKILAERHAGLKVVGAYSPPVGPFSDEENRKMVDMIREAQPDMLFVAFGAPKQDMWIAQHRDQISVPLAVGVGGVFNFVTGRVQRAPGWMQKSGMEWLFRVLQEPQRLWRRYFLLDMPVLARIATDALRTRTLAPSVAANSRRAQPQLSMVAPRVVPPVAAAMSGLPAETLRRDS
jgi:N-acetylglucosaminyldiphosphoundecaprenol N-acetyl-beta-D-mannosaminyltransferase